MSIVVTLVGGLRKIVVNGGDAYFVSHNDKGLIPNYTGDKVLISLFGSQAINFTDLTSGANIGLELAGNGNFTGSADDSVTLVLCEIGGTQRWREIARSVN